MTEWLKHKVQNRLSALGLGPIEAATAVGIERTFIRDIVNGNKRSVRADGAAKLELALRAPREHFLYEDHQLDVSFAPAAENPPAAAATSPAAFVTAEIVEIPEYDVRLSAGAGGELTTENVKRKHTFAKNLIVHEMGLNPSQLSIEEVHGDSMYPTLTNGDRVMVNHADKNVYMMGIFAVWTGYGVVIKRVQVIDNVRPIKVRLISDNSKYDPLDYDPEDVNIIGRVVWRAQNMI